MSRARKLCAEPLEERQMLAADFSFASVPDARAVVSQYAIDGSGNNLEDPDLGSTDEQLLRIVSVDYADGISEPAGSDRASPRDISNAVVAQTESIVNDRHLTDLVWLWGQFIDHDLDLTENADPAEPMPIAVSPGDAWFDPLGYGNVTIDFNRSTYDPETGDSVDNPRQQINQITAFLDGSVIYGSDEARAEALREGAGGRLLTSAGDLLPFNVDGYANAELPFLDSSEYFLAGDVRANENAALTAMHTLWVREHNRIADEIAAKNPELSDDQIFERAKAIMVAELQAITYNEFLPALLGTDAISPYDGYDSSVDPSISNLFSTAAYRFGHSMLSSTLLRLDADGSVADEGNLDLAGAFFAPGEITANGIDSLLLGAANQNAQEIDNQIVDAVRNFLFGPPGAGGFDLASLNIQRGRDHGLPGYNQVRAELGLEPAASFADISSNPDVQAALASVYASVDDIDVWVGALAEDHAPVSSVGELLQTVLVDQFERIRDGDRFWYQKTFRGRQLAEIEKTTLGDVIERNTEIDGLQKNVFFDESVLTYRNEHGRRSAHVTVTAQNDHVEIVGRGRRVLASQPADEVSQVMLVGSVAAHDHFTIDFGRGELAPADGFIVEGGDGRRDVLTIRGTSAEDKIIVEKDQITVNETVIAYSGVERIVILTGPGQDDVQIADGVDTWVRVDRLRPEFAARRALFANLGRRR